MGGKTESNDRLSKKLGGGGLEEAPLEPKVAIEFRLSILQRDHARPHLVQQTVRLHPFPFTEDTKSRSLPGGDGKWIKHPIECNHFEIC